MLITRQTDYAIRCAVLLAQAPSRLLSAATIAETMDIPRPFVSKILQKLTRARLTRATRGAAGGFSLARDPAAVSLYDVVVAIQGAPTTNECAVDARRCSRSRGCTVHPVWVRLRHMVEEQLQQTSLTALTTPPADPATRSPRPRRKG